MCAEAKDAGMKTLIALDDQEVKSKLSSYLLQGMSNHSYSLKYQRLGEGGWGEQNLNFSRKSKMGGSPYLRIKDHGDYCFAWSC